MLVLSRKVGQKIEIGDNITVVVQKISGNRISIGIEAPREVRVVRGELAPAVRQFEPESQPTAESKAPQILRFDEPELRGYPVVGVHRAR